MAFSAASISAMINDRRVVQFNGRDIVKGDLVAMRAVCRLYACQLADEKAVEATRHSNDIGFNHAHAKMGSALASFMDCNRKDGVLRRLTAGRVNKFVFDGVDANGKKKFHRFNSSFVGRDRVEVCRYLAGFYAQQLADFANGDVRRAKAKVARSNQ